MIEQMSVQEKEVADARARVRAQIEEYCLPVEQMAAIDEMTPIPGLRERPMGVISGR